MATRLGSVWYFRRSVTVVGLAGVGGLLTSNITWTSGNLRSVVDSSAVWMILGLLVHDGMTMARSELELLKRPLTLVCGICRRPCEWHTVFR